MNKCQFCQNHANNSIYGIHVCYQHNKSPVIEGLISDFYKKEHEIMGANYNIMKRKLSMAYTRPWKNLIEYYRVKWGLDK